MSEVKITPAGDELRPAAHASAGQLSRPRRLAADVLAGGRAALVFPLIGAVILLLLPLFGSAYWVNQISLIACFAMVVSGVNLSFGYAGEVQFGQVFMFALGAYLTMVLAVKGFDEIIPLMIIGGLAAAAVGFIIAIPALRIGGWSLAMASFFLVITIPDLVSIFMKWTGGDDGLVGIPVPNLFGQALSTNALYEVALIVALLWMLCYRNLVTSRYGVIFRVLRESPVLAQSLGFSTMRLKVLAYTMGALPAGIAGCLYGFISLILAPSNFDIALSVGIVAATVLGGVESVYGVILGAAILQLGPEESLSFANYAPIAYGVFLIIAAVALRQGIGGLGKSLALKLSRKLVSGDARLSAAEVTSMIEGSVEDEATAEESAAAKKAALSKFDGQLLTIENVSKAYGGVKALQGVSLRAKPGEVTALIGSNGSGKTTLLNVICGYAVADNGSVTFGDGSLSGLAPHQIASLGVARTFQTPSVPSGVSVLDVAASGRFRADHIGVLGSILRLPKYRRAKRVDRLEAMELLRIVGLDNVADQPATSLPLGNRRLLEVARALCGKPKLLLLDEPASGLSETEVQRLGELVHAAAVAGATVILIEHNFGFVTKVSDIAHVLHLGQLLASGPAATIADDPRVVESYLGEQSGQAEVPTAAPSLDGAPEPQPADREVVLEATGLESGYGDLRVLRNVSLTVHKGEIEVVLGRNGVGKTTLLSTLSGQISLWEGSISLDGQEIRSAAAYKRTSRGVALVQEGKRIFRNRTIWENVMIGTHTLRLGRRERHELCMSLLEQFPILKDRANQKASGLSGGQQQMLAIAQALASRPKLLLLDEPSAGLAPAIVSEVFERIRVLADAGLSVILVEQLAERALGIADHVTVLDSGIVVASGPPSDFSNLDDLQEAYFGASHDAVAVDGAVVVQETAE